MAKMFFSLGFWMTIVLFISLGYVFGAELPSPLNYSAEEHTIGGPLAPRDEASQYVDQNNQNGAAVEDRELRGCPSNESPNKFPPSYSAERQGPRFAPGLTFTLGDKPARMSSLCAGPVEIPRS
jgi:hypothetical protein